MMKKLQFFVIMDLVLLGFHIYLEYLHIFSVLHFPFPQPELLCLNSKIMKVELLHQNVCSFLTFHIFLQTAYRLNIITVLIFRKMRRLRTARSLFFFSQFIFNLKRSLSEIIAINSLFVGFPRLFCTV